jgi:hypothetical protein
VEVKTVEQVTFPAQTTIDEDKISELLGMSKIEFYFKTVVFKPDI